MSLEKAAKILPVVAAMLGNGWRFNKILSDVHGYRGFLLTNDSDLMIDVRTEYNHSLPQWSLCYRSPKYKHIMFCERIGCSFEKSVAAIAADIENRLLTQENINNAQNKFNKDAHEVKKSKTLNEDRDHVIHALNQVLDLSVTKSHVYERYDILDADSQEVAALKHNSNNVDSFEFKMSGLSAAQIICITHALGLQKKQR